MFGVRETLPPNAPPVKTYRCVACSATFNGLASLLVHQASHAGEFSNPPPPPTCSSCGTVFGSKDLLKQHTCAEAFRSTASDLYICDCGGEWHDFSAYVEHRKSQHGASDQNHNETQQSNVTPQGLKDDSFVKPATGNSDPLSLSSPEVSLTSSSVNVPPECSDSNGISEMDCTKEFPKQNSSLCQQPEQALDPTKPDLLVANLEEKNNFSPDSEIDEFNVSNNSALSKDNTEVPQKENQDTKPSPNKVVMKLLANAYMNVKKLPEHSSDSSSEGTPAATSDVTPSPKRQLRPSLRRPLYLPFPRIVDSTDPPKKKILSVTRRYCPVVLLETRQTFVGDGKDMQEKYQCGQCKCLFSDIDKLVVHHTLHRKERLKCCRRCKQFVIGTNGPDNHTCSIRPTSVVKGLLSKGKASPKKGSPKKILQVHKPTQFTCPLCNHSYTRLYNLKKHNCPSIPSKTSSTKDTGGVTDINSQDEEISRHGLRPDVEFVNIGVGTDVQRHLKKEMVNTEIVTVDNHQTNIEHSFDIFQDGDVFDSSPSQHSAEPITSEPFENDLEAEHVGTDQPEDDATCFNERDEGSPVEDAEIDVLIEADDDNDDDNLDNKNNILHQILVQGRTVSKAQNPGISGNYSNEHMNRYTCGRCHKSFTRNYGLNKHLKICAVGRIRQHNAGTSVAHKVFECSQCGKGFNHLDSLTIHKRNCYPKMGMRTEHSGSYNPSRQENVFVLPPLSENPTSRQESTEGSNETNWGIMSLPSVLPRRVTCECGAAFTCPRRLFEHLQMHAQESYICPQCGENLQSWVKYEAHLRSHVHYQSASEDQSKQYVASYQQPQSYMQRPQQSAVQLNSLPPVTSLPTQASSCPKCCKAFNSRRSLLRHLRRSCCGKTNAPKKYACSRCGMSFLSAYTLDLHMQSNTCTPSAKTLRCPVCVRSFSSVEGLKRHLVIHSQNKTFSCHMCSQTFQTAKDLEGHRKSVHDILQQEQSLVPGESREEITITSNNRLFKFFRCNMCPRMYHSMKSLKEHRKKVHSLLGGHATQTGESSGAQNSQMIFFRCQLCQRTYPTLKSLKNHRRRVHRILEGNHVPQKADLSGVAQNSPSTIFRCQICHRAYPTLKAWRNHRRRVHRILGGGPEIQTSESLRVTQSPSPGFTCQTCQITYSTLHLLREHRRKAHLIPEAVSDSQKGDAIDVLNSKSLVFACQICDRTYSKLQSLKDHRRKVHRIPGGQLDVVKVE